MLQAEGTLTTLQARMLGVAEARGLIRWADGAVDGAYSPWPGGRQGRCSRRQGQGLVIHRLTAGGGLPWAHRPAPAQGDERAAVQVWYPRPRRGWKAKQTRGPLNTSCHYAKPSARLPGFRRHPGGWGSAGSGWRLLCGVAGDRHHVRLDAQTNSGIDAW